MKVVTAALVLAALARVEPATGQTAIDRGSWIVGGTVRVHRLYEEGNNQHEFGFELAPQVGFFVTRGLALNLNARLGWADREETATAFKWGWVPA